MNDTKSIKKLKITKSRNTKKTILGLSFSFLGLQNINFWGSYSLQQTLKISPVPSIKITKNDQNESIPTINVVAETVGKVSSIFDLMYNGKKVTDFNNVKCEYIGDPELANKVALDTDFGIKWTDQIKAGKYDAKWSVIYKNKKVETPPITFNCLSQTEYNQQEIKVVPKDKQPTKETKDKQPAKETAEIYDIVTREEKFKYSDIYFAKPSSQYNPSLAVASYGMLNCSGNYEGGTVKESDKWIKELVLDQFKFQNYEQIGYRTPTTSESVGAVIASKEIYLQSEKSTLLCLPIRSFSYNKEWADNMFVGDGTANDTRTITSTFDSKQYTFANKYKNHAGFCLSAMVVLNFLRQYIEKYNITGKVKIWLAGYSRGGAIANITAALLDRAIHENNLEEYLGKNIKCDISHDDIYAYTMGTPQGAYADQYPNPRSAIYNNIYNLINPNDVVTQIPLKEWGFTRYGVDKYMTTRTIDPNYDANKNAWKKQMKNPGLIEKIDNFNILKINGTPSDEFLNMTPQIAWHILTSGIAEEMPYRTEYSRKIQYSLKWLMDEYIMGDKSEINWWDILYAIFKGIGVLELINNVKVIAMVTSIIKGSKDIIGDIHSYDNYFSYAKANDLSYVSKQDQVQLIDEYTFYEVYTRGFDQVNMIDTSNNSYLFNNFPKPIS